MELSINFLSIGIDRNAQVFHFEKPEASVTLIICKFPSLLVKFSLKANRVAHERNLHPSKRYS
jgi:hypothetical protein